MRKAKKKKPPENCFKTKTEVTYDMSQSMGVIQAAMD